MLRADKMAPQLPNSPLVEVVLEMRFAGDLGYQAAWPAIHADIRSEYPSILVPAAISGTAPQLQPIQLASEDQRERVMMSLNAFGVATSRYTGFEAFVQAFGNADRVFRRHGGTRQLKRLGLRYTNRIPNGFPGSDAAEGARRLHPCLKLSVGGWNALPRNDIEPSQLVFASGDPSRLALRISLTADAQDPSGAATFDLDCFRQGDIDHDDVNSFMVDAHELIESTFLELVTSEYHSYLKGER